MPRHSSATRRHKRNERRGATVYMDWESLFERGNTTGVDVDAIGNVLQQHRDRTEVANDNGTGAEETSASGADFDRVDSKSGSTRESGSVSAQDGSESPPVEPSPARVVADADVLAADLLVGEAARDALDHLWLHSWTSLVASDRLLSDTESVITELTDSELATDWRSLVEKWRETVEHPRSDHPGVASAYRGGAMHLLSYDDSLTSAQAGAALGIRIQLSIREPRAFCTLFDAERLYNAVVGGSYPGPDRESRR